jgi:membrane protein DedA with SNARE-associated domain
MPLLSGPLLASGTGAGSTEDLSGVAAWAVSLMESLGAPGAGVAVALENLFPPLPSELILPLAGFTASQGDFGLVSAIVWTTTGSLLGALALYAIGATLGLERTRRLVGRIPLMTVDDVDRSKAWFDRHGRKAVFFGRFVPLFRSMISVPAGIDRMPVATFALLTATGSLVWNTAFILAGYALGENWELVGQYAGYVSNAVVLAVVAVLAWFVVVRVRRRRREAAAAQRAGTDGPAPR